MYKDEIVITGIAGKFPDCENVASFQKRLLNMEKCIRSKNPLWETGDLKFPEMNGQMVDLDKFDTQSFGIYKKHAMNMCPLARSTLQYAYEAVADAGINPRTLKGKKIAVFTGVGIGEEGYLIGRDLPKSSITGAARTMLANRISFLLGLEGPSATVNSLETSSGTALEKGYCAIRNGEVESAIVGGGNLALHPYLSLHYLNLGLLSPDGVTRSFDKDANGFTRSEAVTFLFLQKAKDAKRIYAEIKNIHSLNGPSYERLSVLYPTYDCQKEVMKTTLKECGLSGKDISFVEADGLGIKEADAEEIKAIDQVYNEERQAPLFVGSVKSNVGSCHGANTLVSIIKIITMMEFGQIPPNLNYNHPSEQIPAIHEGRIQIVNAPTSWNGEYATVNTTSIGGGFTTVILKSPRKIEKKQQLVDNLPKLLMVSGVNENAVNTILDYMTENPFNAEMFQLINDIFETENPIHLYRGYSLLPAHGKPNPRSRVVQFVSDFKKEIWYIFSGMGSQWAGMGKNLMGLPVFAESVRKCDAALKVHGIDIIHIITADDPKMFDNIVNSFVGIITIQVALVDVLTYLGIKPDFIIGHSVGELGSGYADGCLTAEEAVLNALYRGLATVDSKMPKGLMAAVGLGYQDVKALCPPDIDVACHNSADSSTISGPEDSMKKFVSTLQDRGIFAKEVQTSNIAFHSRYIKPAGKKLMKYLHKIIPDSKVRSCKWISTSVPNNEWDTAKARLSSAEYYTNNLLNPVLFEEVTKMIPSNAITIEIAPHGLMQAILKRSLPSTVTNISLSKRGHENNIEVLMDAIGKLYINYGGRAQIMQLYPKINYPVSPGVPSISSLMKWNPSEIRIKKINRLFSLVNDKSEKTYTIDLNKESWKFLRGNKIGNKIVVPFTLYMHLALSIVRTFDDSARQIIFENIVIHKNKCINEDQVLELTVMVQKVSGSFEVTTDESILLCSGILKKIDSIEEVKPDIENLVEELNELESNYIYNELLLRGYHYSKPFRNIMKLNHKGSYGYILYQEDWHLFLDGMLQMYVFENSHKTTQVPLKIRKIVINLNSYKKSSEISKAIPVSVDRQFDIIRSCGMEVHGVQFRPFKQISNSGSIKVEEMKLTLYDEIVTSPTEFVELLLQILNENCVNGGSIQILEKTPATESQKSWITTLKILQAKFKIEIVSSMQVLSNKKTVLQIFFDTTTLRNSLSKEGDFSLLILESPDENKVSNTINSFDLGVILKHRTLDNKVALLLRKTRTFRNVCFLEITDNVSDQITEKLDSQKVERIVLFSSCKDNEHEIFTRSKAIELNKQRKIRYLEMIDKETPNLDDPLYQKQLQLDLKFNILTPERKWGFWRHFPIVNKRYSVDNYEAVQIRQGDFDSFDWVKPSDCIKQSFNWVKTPFKSVKQPTKQHFDHSQSVRVEYSTINAFDVSQAEIFNPNEKIEANPDKESKRINQLFGLEFAGINTKGDQVMGISQNGTLRTFTSPDTELTWRVPNEWTLEEAATVPLAYATAYMALYLKGEIQRNSSIFIYDGVNPLGQALINLSVNEKSRIFSTYRTKEEKQRLLLRHVSLEEEQLCGSDDDFKDRVLSLTKGEGVDLVIYNSCNVKQIEKCLSLVKKAGRLIIVGELESAFERSMGMLVFLNQVSVYSIIPQNLVHLDIETKKRLSCLMNDGLKKGIVKPVFSKLFLRDELKHAFVNAREYYGKTVIKIQPMHANSGLAINRFSNLKNKTYLLLIDSWNNLFGIKLIEFLIERGAKDILVISTTRHITKVLYYHYSKIWKESEARVVLEDDLDLSESDNANSFLSKVCKINPVGVIFDLQRMGTNSLCSKDSITKKVLQEAKKVCVYLDQFIICTTVKDANEDLKSRLFWESNLHTFCEDKTSGVLSKMILWGPIEEIVHSKFSTKMNNLLTISQCMEELDCLMPLTCPCVIVSKDVNLTSATKQTTVVKQKEEKELFEDYIHEGRKTLF